MKVLVRSNILKCLIEVYPREMMHRVTSIGNLVYRWLHRISDRCHLTILAPSFQTACDKFLMEISKWPGISVAYVRNGASSAVALKFILFVWKYLQHRHSSDMSMFLSCGLLHQQRPVRKYLEIYNRRPSTLLWFRLSTPTVS